MDLVLLFSLLPLLLLILLLLLLLPLLLLLLVSLLVFGSLSCLIRSRLELTELSIDDDVFLVLSFSFVNDDRCDFDSLAA